MSITATNWVAGFQAGSKALEANAASWLQPMRQRAFDRYMNEGWPVTKQENWHHTSLANMALQVFYPASQSSDNRQAAEQALHDMREGENGHWLVFVDGHFSPVLSEVGVLPAGVQVLPLSQAMSSHTDQIQAVFGDELSGSSTAALNLALATDGAFIHLSRGVVLQQPVHLAFITTTEQGASFPRNIIIADSGAQASIIEHYTGTNESTTLTNAVTRASIATDANISHLKLQQETHQAFHLADIDVQQATKSVYKSHSMSFGAKLARNDIATHFTGDHCETLLNGLYYVDGRRHVDHNTVIGHAHPDGISHEYYRGILSDQGRGVFSGRILVAPGADRTDAIQRSDSLLLSRLARADSRPELEIYADDVKCAHGATVGKLDEDSLFYLRSRGLDAVTARNVLIYAFAAESLARIDIASLRKRVETVIRGLLPDAQAIGADA